jgi:hypothetical protein
VGRKLARSVVEYYVALRISASAATAYWPMAHPREPQPIVRVAQAAHPAGFDPRELFTAADGGVCVITLPQRHATATRARAFSLN